MPGFTHPKWEYQLVEDFDIIQKYTSLFTSFLRYYTLKDPVIWLADNFLAHNLRLRIFPRYWIGGEISITISVFILDYSQEKLVPKFFKISKKKTYSGGAV